MTVLATKHLTLVDLMKQKVGESIESDIAEIMSETDVVLKNLHVKECNDGTNNKAVIRSGLPSGTFRKIYGFVAPEKSETQNVVDSTGMLEAYSVVDVDLVDKANNKAQFRLNESKAFIEGMTQTAVQTIFYGSKKENDAKFDGLSVRFSELSDDPKKIGFNIVDAGGTGSNNTSAWFVTTGEQEVALLYPQGSKGGLYHHDDGVLTETDEKGGKRKVYQEHFKHDLGLTIKDWRSSCRIANIDVDSLEAGEVKLLDFFRKAFFKVNKFINKSGQKTFIFCNSAVAEALDKLATDKSNVMLNIKDYGGTNITHYKNIPILCTDMLLNTEERVVKRQN